MPLTPDVIVDQEAHHDGEWMCTPEMYDAEKQWPQWTRGEVAKTFFAMNPATFYSKIYQGGSLVPGFIDEGPPRKADHLGTYTWRLCDIERAAKGLALNGKIPLRTLTNCMGVLRAVAKQHGYL